MATSSSSRRSRSRDSTGSAESRTLSVTITLAADGLLGGFDAQGHAGDDPAGRNIACAAATILLRTTSRLCAQAGAAAGGRGESGVIRLVVSRGSVDPGWLRGVTEFFLRGMRDLQDEYPEDVVLRVKRTED